MSTGDNLRKIADVLDKLDEAGYQYYMHMVSKDADEVCLAEGLSELITLNLHSKDSVFVLDSSRLFRFVREIEIDGIRYTKYHFTEAEAREG